MCTAHVLFTCCLVMFSAASECGGDARCDAAKDVEALLQNTVKLADKADDANVTDLTEVDDANVDDAQAVPPCFLKNVLITSHRGQNLQDYKGQVRLSSNAGGWEQWWITAPGPKGNVYIKSHRDHNLQDNNGRVKLSYNARSWELWTIRDAGNGKVFIKSHKNKNLQDNNGAVRLSGNTGGGETWSIRDTNGKQLQCTQASSSSSSSSSPPRRRNGPSWIRRRRDKSNNMKAIMKIFGQPCRGDDCESKAMCPTGYNAVACASQPVNHGDGLSAYHHGCSAWGSDHMGTTPIRSVATCSNLQNTSVTSSGSNWQIGTWVKADQCEGGQKPLWCYCHSKWHNCVQTSFAPLVSRCAQRIPRQRWGRGAIVYALCPAAVQCTGNQYVMTSGASIDCLDDCPPGYLSVNSKSSDEGHGEGHGHGHGHGHHHGKGHGDGHSDSAGRCEPCQGSSARRRTQVCNACGPGTLPATGQDECVNIQESCNNDGDPPQCTACATCMSGIEPTLKSCVGEDPGACYNPGTTWCAAAISGLSGCQTQSMGCWYKLLCSSACICDGWKQGFCGDRNASKPCSPTLVAFLNINRTQEEEKQALQLRATAGEKRDSLDETLDDKEC